MPSGLVPGVHWLVSGMARAWHGAMCSQIQVPLGRPLLIPAVRTCIVVAHSIPRSGCAITRIGFWSWILHHLRIATGARAQQSRPSRGKTHERDCCVGGRSSLSPVGWGLISDEALVERGMKSKVRLYSPKQCLTSNTADLSPCQGAYTGIFSTSCLMKSAV